jgi:DNA-binding LytR/AlgR family response regulator
MKLNCIIIDDEPVARKVLKEFIQDIDFLELVGEADHPLKAMALIEAHSIDVIFLDIQMPKINGIDFLKSTAVQSAVIMTTAYADYAVEAYGLNVLDYLLKPISFERFLKACNKAREYSGLKKTQPVLTSTTNDYFFVKCDNQIERINYDNLLYAEAMLNYVMLHTSTKKMMVYLTIKSLEEQLPSNLFIKVHKSFIVNRTKVSRIEGNVLDVGDAKITISQNLREKVLHEILNGRIIKR